MGNAEIAGLVADRHSVEADERRNVRADVASEPRHNGAERWVMRGAVDALAVTGHALPTILITGRDDETTRSMVERSEAIAVLFKPVDERVLLEAISRCFNSQPGNSDAACSS